MATMANGRVSPDTMTCPPVGGDNPRALVSGLSYIQVDKHGRPCTSRDNGCYSW